MFMQLKNDAVPNVECLTDQHFQLYQTWRIIHLLSYTLLSYSGVYEKVSKTYVDFFFFTV